MVLSVVVSRGMKQAQILHVYLQSAQTQHPIEAPARGRLQQARPQPKGVGGGAVRRRKSMLNLTGRTVCTRTGRYEFQVDAMGLSQTRRPQDTFLPCRDDLTCKRHRCACTGRAHLLFRNNCCLCTTCKSHKCRRSCCCRRRRRHRRRHLPSHTGRKCVCTRL